MADNDYSFLNEDLEVPYHAKTNTELFGSTEAPEENKFAALLKNPNFIQAMAKTGAMLDPTGVGGAVGTAAYDWSKNESMQKATAKQKSGQDTQMKQLINMLGEDKLISPPDDNSKANSVTFNGDGSYDLKGTTVDAKAGIPNFGTDDSLESIQNINVPKNPLEEETYQGLSEEDYQGLDSSQLATLMQDDKRSGDIMDKVYANKLAEIKYGRDVAASKKTAEAKVEATKVKNTFEKELSELEAEQQKELARYKSTLPNKGNTMAEISLMRARIAEMQLNLNVGKQAYTEKKDKTETETKTEDKNQAEVEFVLNANNKIMSKQTPMAQAESAATKFNKGENDRVLYKQKGNLLSRDTMQEFQIPSTFMYNGKQMTSKDIMLIAEKNGWSVTETLEKLMEKATKK